jgi:hypothetical protein
VRLREVLAGSAAGGGVPLSAASVPVAAAGVVATVRVSHLAAGGAARSLAWLLPVNAGASGAVARLELWTPAAADASGAVLRVDVRGPFFAVSFALRNF